MKRIILCVMLLAFTLCACTQTPKSAEELLEFNKKAISEVESEHIDSIIDMSIKAKYNDTDIEMPIKMDMSTDAQKKKSHTNGKLSMSVMGINQSSDFEMYTDEKNSYMKMGDGDWAKEEDTIDVEQFTEMPSKKLVEKMEFGTSKDSYILSCDAKKIGESIDVEDITGILGDASYKDLKIKSGVITYKFSKKTNLMKEMDIENMEIAAKEPSTGTDIAMTMNFNIKISNYNKIKTINIPKEVKNE